MIEKIQHMGGNKIVTELKGFVSPERVNSQKRQGQEFGAKKTKV